MIQVVNNGQDIDYTDYFDSEIAQKGYLMASINAGCLRVLLPDQMSYVLNEIKTADHVVVSKGPSEKFAGGGEMWEIMFEDYSETPFGLFIGGNQFAGFVPSLDNSAWDFSVWTRQGCAFRSKAYMRKARVEIPCLQSWGQEY